MLHVDGVVVSLRKTARDGLSNAEETIEERRAKERIVDEVMGQAVDVGIHHERINEAHDEHHPERRVRIKKKHRQEIGEMKKAASIGTASQRVWAKILNWSSDVRCECFQGETL